MLVLSDMIGWKISTANQITYVNQALYKIILKIIFKWIVFFWICQKDNKDSVSDQN